VVLGAGGLDTRDASGCLLIVHARQRAVKYGYARTDRGSSHVFLNSYRQMRVEAAMPDAQTQWAQPLHQIRYASWRAVSTN